MHCFRRFDALSGALYCHLLRLEEEKVSERPFKLTQTDFMICSDDWGGEEKVESRFTSIALSWRYFDHITVSGAAGWRRADV